MAFAMGFTLSEVFKCEPDDEALRLISEFAAMVKWWVEKARDFHAGSFEAFRKRHYGEWVERWPNLSAQLIHTSAASAYSLMRLYKKPEERPKIAEMDVQHVVLHPKMLKLSGGKLRVSVSKGDYAYVALKPISVYQSRLLEQAEAGWWRLGQAVLTRGWVAISFVADDLDEQIVRKVSQLVGVEK